MSPVETDAVIFDFDGVIADSTAAVEHQWSEFARHFGLDVLALLADVHGRRSADVLPEWVSPSRIEEATAWMRATAFDHREVALLPGAADAIAAVSTARWAIASSASKELIEGRLQDDGLPLPAALVSASDVTHGKPDPECYVRGVLELGRGRDADALAALQSAEKFARRLAKPHYLLAPVRALRLLALVRLGETARAEQDLAGLSEQDRERGEIRIALAALRLAQHDPHAAMAALGPVLDRSSVIIRDTWRVTAFVLEVHARDVLGEQGAAASAMERALDLAEPEGALWFFLLCPEPAVLERHLPRRTTHAALVAELRSLLAATGLVPSPGPRPATEPLSESELRVLRYLPTNLTTPEIAGELGVSRNTIKSHTRNLYAKLGTHGRTEAVDRARALGLLAPSYR